MTAKEKYNILLLELGVLYEFCNSKKKDTAMDNPYKGGMRNAILLIIIKHKDYQQQFDSYELRYHELHNLIKNKLQDIKFTDCDSESYRNGQIYVYQSMLTSINNLNNQGE